MSRWQSGIDELGSAAKALEFHLEAIVEPSNVCAVYDAIAPSYARHRGARKFVVEILHRLHSKSPGGSVLEVGCGAGAYASALAQTGSRMISAMERIACHGVRSSHRSTRGRLGARLPAGRASLNQAEIVSA